MSGRAFEPALTFYQGVTTLLGPLAPAPLPTATGPLGPFAADPLPTDTAPEAPAAEAPDAT